ncbi:MAG TPA: hypothetical protein VIP11_17150 [Gemmatimonadaceae bacterium]
MKRVLGVLAVTLALAASAGAQGGMPQMPKGMQHAMADGGCPLHLTTLGLTADQEQKYAAIRTAHMGEMKALPDSGRPAAMKASMAKTIESVRAILTPDQLKTFEAAVIAHEEHGEKMKATGHECSCTCCGTGGKTSCSEPTVTKPPR